MSAENNEKIVIQSVESSTNKMGGHHVNVGDWNEYSRLVLKELNSLSEGLKYLRNEMEETKDEILKIQTRLDTIDDLKNWKNKFDEIASVTRVKDLVKDVDDLKIFRIKAVTVFAVVQFSMVAFGIFSKYIS